MSIIHSLIFILLILVVIGIIVGVHSVLNKDTIEKETINYKKQIYIVTGIFCILLILGFFVFVSKTK